jgi:hypothetical protein
MRILAIWVLVAAIMLVLSSNSTLFPVRAASAPSSGLPSLIPAGVLTYVSERAGQSGCLIGTVSPFTVSSMTCDQADAITPQKAYTLNCSGSGTNGCQAGTSDTPSSHFAGFNGYSQVPSSNPTKSYYNPSVVSYWIGLQSCITAPCSPVYLLQAGIVYGVNSTANSQHPHMFVEYFSNNNSTGCFAFCGKLEVVSPGDYMYFEIYYYSTYGEWIVFAEDETTNPYTYITEYVPYASPPNGNYIPYTSLPYALATTEGQKATSASYWPTGTLTFSDMVGYNANGNYLIGTSNWWVTKSGSAPTATLGESQFSCSVGSTQTTCQSTTIAIS